jgi:hypothetical protein
MGCTICRRKQEVEVVINRAHQTGYKDLFYATNEFDLSRSDSENEEEEKNSSLNTIKNAKQQITKEITSPSNELNSTNNNSSTIVNDDMVNNEIVQNDVELFLKDLLCDIFFYK